MLSNTNCLFKWKKTEFNQKKIKQFIKSISKKNYVILTIRINDDLKIEYFDLTGSGNLYFITSYFEKLYNKFYLCDEIYHEQTILNLVDALIEDASIYKLFI